MKIFALETRKEKFITSLLAPNERVILATNFHIFRFLPGILRFLILTVVAGALWYWSVTLLLPDFTPWIIAAVWVLFVLFPFINLLIDWWHDAIILTDEEVVIVDQQNIFRRTVRQMSLENIASVTDRTQWGDVFNFGKLLFDLKEGVGQHITIPFVPGAGKVASSISEAVVQFHRREIEQPRNAHVRPAPPQP